MSSGNDEKLTFSAWVDNINLYHLFPINYNWRLTNWYTIFVSLPRIACVQEFLGLDFHDLLLFLCIELHR